MKKITYLIPVYNEIRTVRRAIEDIINLKYYNKEIIIIDNGSTDGSQKIKNTYKNNPIKFLASSLLSSISNFFFSINFRSNSISLSESSGYNLINLKSAKKS